MSHYPTGYKQDKIVGMGLNDEELKRNPVPLDNVFIFLIKKNNVSMIFRDSVSL